MMVEVVQTVKGVKSIQSQSIQKLSWLHLMKKRLTKEEVAMLKMTCANELQAHNK